MSLPHGFFPATTVPAALQGVLKHAEGRLSKSLAQADNLAELHGQASLTQSWLGLDINRRQHLARVMTVSTFALDTLVRHPDWLPQLAAGGELDAAPGTDELTAWLEIGRASCREGVWSSVA